MHGAADRGTVAAMPIPDFTQAAGAPPPASPSPAIPPAPAQNPLGDGTPPYEPAVDRFPVDLGDGWRQRIPEDVVPTGLMSEEDRIFEIRQPTIAENCRAMRFAFAGDMFDQGKAVQLVVRYAVRRVGNMTGAALGDEQLDRWFGALGYHGFHLVKELVDDVIEVRPHEAKAFEASKRDDFMGRRFARTLPAGALPKKRWAARVGIKAQWIDTYAGEDDAAKEKRLAEGRPRTVIGGQWTVGDKLADEAQVLLCTRDLSFTMKELKIDEAGRTIDYVEDPEDRHAVRVMQTMLAITDIGGVAYGTSPEHLVKKLQWMEDIGPRNRQMVTGMFARLHEVDLVGTAKFREAATPLD